MYKPNNYIQLHLLGNNMYTTDLYKFIEFSAYLYTYLIVKKKPNLTSYEHQRGVGMLIGMEQNKNRTGNGNATDFKSHGIITEDRITKLIIRLSFSFQFPTN